MSPSDCAICLCPSSAPRTLGCGHSFHADCIDMWTRTAPFATCPSCRAPYGVARDLVSSTHRERRKRLAVLVAVYVAVAALVICYPTGGSFEECLSRFLFGLAHRLLA
jgi:hypothetical protein